MDSAVSQVIASIIGAIASIIVAFVAGYFTVQAAQVSAASSEFPASEEEKRGRSTLPGEGEMVLPSWLPSLAVGLVGLVISFALAFTGNFLFLAFHTPSQILWIPFLVNAHLIGDSIDPALVGGLMSMIGFWTGRYTYHKVQGMGKVIILWLITGVFSSPVGFSLAYIGNWLQRREVTGLFSDSLDSLIIASVMAFAGFGVGFYTGCNRRN